MTRLQARARGAIRRHGDAFTVSSVSHFGVVSPLPIGLAQRYADATAFASSGPPWQGVLVPWDDTTTVGQVATWNGLTYTVRAVVPREAYGQTVAKLLVFGRP